MTYRNYNSRINRNGNVAEDRRSFANRPATASEAAAAMAGRATMRTMAATWTRKERDGKVYWMNELTGVTSATDPTEVA